MTTPLEVLEVFLFACIVGDAFVLGVVVGIDFICWRLK